MEYVSIYGGACIDCTMAIANDDYSGMNDETEAAVRDAVQQACEAAAKCGGNGLVIGDETGFTWKSCGICGGLAGDRHEVGYLIPNEVKA